MVNNKQHAKEIRRRKQAEDLLDRLLTWALANRRGNYEFVRCYTYGSGNFPQVIKDTKEFLGESTAHMTNVYPDKD